MRAVKNPLWQDGQPQLSGSALAGLQPCPQHATGQGTVHLGMSPRWWDPRRLVSPWSQALSPLLLRDPIQLERRSLPGPPPLGLRRSKPFWKRGWRKSCRSDEFVDGRFGTYDGAHLDGVPT